MRIYLKIFVLFLITGLLISSTSCNKNGNSALKDEKLTPQNIMDIANKIKDDKAMTKDDIDLFANGLIRLSAYKDTLKDKTVGQIIEAQGKFMRESSIESLLINSSRTEMAMAHTFKWGRMQAYDNNEQKTNVISFQITNNSDKPIINLQGYVNIINAQNQLVKTFPVNIQKVIKNGETIDVQSQPYKHDENVPNDVLLRTAQGLRAVWQPILVEFQGGKKLTLTPNKK